MAAKAPKKLHNQYLVIVESPTKAKTIRKFLPKNYIVEASMGHVRDLPQSAADIPKDLKKEDWAKLGVRVDQKFEPLYIVPKGKSKIVRELKKQMKTADAIYLATDEDREGESISWHLMELLKPKIPVKRMVFHEITKSAILKALEDCRDIDVRLVRAQEARRILDRLYGYTLSPLLWKKIAYGLSAGRVQSTGLRLIAEREKERIRFKSASYWDLKAELSKKGETKNFDAKLVQVDGKRVASGKDFGDETGKLLKPDQIKVLNEKEARDLSEEIKTKDWKISSVEEKTSYSNPSPPFITSTLQQEGNRKLRMSAKETMRTAQRLYEEGLITYMRTDSPNLSSQAIQGARSSIEDLYGKDFLSEKPRQYSSKSKGAQEAHEAIRPAGSDFVHPDKAGLSGREKALYELIWKRTMATQMSRAQKASVSVKIEAGRAQFQANGTQIIFPGFLRVYVEGKDDPEAALDDREVLLPILKEGETVAANKIEALGHETRPPARFTEASLVQRLEKEGVGRPSTYASIISTIQDRGYVRKEQSALIPSFTGLAVIQLLERHFPHLVDYSFTSGMENSLDQIAYGKKDWLEYLDSFYNGKDGLKQTVETKEKKIKPEESRSVELAHLKDKVDIKVGRYGPYIVQKSLEGSGEEIHASIPQDLAPADLREEDVGELIELSRKGPEPIGVDPKSQQKIYCLVGRYGAYVQLGEQKEDGEKPRRASLPRGVSPRDVTVEQATKLLSLPKELGLHPETKKPVVANNGRFGPYVVHDGDFRSLKKDDDVYTIELARGLELLAEEKKGRRGAEVLKDFKKHPKSGKKLVIYDGKYGPYIKHGTKNFTLPDDKKDPKVIANLAVEEVVKILQSQAKK